MWVLFTLLAALMQAGRNAAQKQLSVNVPVLGVTLARFLYAVPFALIYLGLHYAWQPTLPAADFNGRFIGFVFAASLAQIAATALMVQLFRLKNYAIGAGLAKSEAIFAAIVGAICFSTPITLLGWLGVLIGAIAVFLLSGTSQLRYTSWKTLLLGTLCGLSFALTSLWVREASLSLTLPNLVAAAWTLCAVITLEALMLSVYLLLWQPHTLRLLLANFRLGVAVSVLSFFGSLGWFSAMSLQHVAYVKTVGQIEVFFMLLISSLIFKEKLQKRDSVGLSLIVIAALFVVWQ